MAADGQTMLDAAMREANSGSSDAGKYAGIGFAPSMPPYKSNLPAALPSNGKDTRPMVGGISVSWGGGSKG